MGFSFRKSVNLGGGLRLNLNKGSVGLSAGRKGARVSANTKGRRTASVSIPGTGLRWQASSGGKRRSGTGR